jgi:hypothetical protein
MLCGWSQRLTVEFISNLYLIEKCYKVYKITIYSNAKRSSVKPNTALFNATSNKISVISEETHTPGSSKWQIFIMVIEEEKKKN